MLTQKKGRRYKDALKPKMFSRALIGLIGNKKTPHVFCGALMGCLLII